MQENKVVFSVLTVNHPGVLLRVTGLFSRRGFNIDSIVACKTQTPEFSRWTLVVTGDEATFIQLNRQLLKMEDVLTVEVLEPDSWSCCCSSWIPSRRAAAPCCAWPRPTAAGCWTSERKPSPWK